MYSRQRSGHFRLARSPPSWQHSLFLVPLARYQRASAHNHQHQSRCERGETANAPALEAGGNPKTLAGANPAARTKTGSVLLTTCREDTAGACVCQLIGGHSNGFLRCHQARGRSPSWWPVRMHSGVLTSQMGSLPFRSECHRPRVSSPNGAIRRWR